jgi:hypothetical protein
MPNAVILCIVPQFYAKVLDDGRKKAVDAIPDL